MLIWLFFSVLYDNTFPIHEAEANDDDDDDWWTGLFSSQSVDEQKR